MTDAMMQDIRLTFIHLFMLFSYSKNGPAAMESEGSSPSSKA
jgi:hypothetical protein